MEQLVVLSYYLQYTPIKEAEKMFVYDLYYFIDGKVVTHSGKVIVHKIVLHMTSTML